MRPASSARWRCSARSTALRCAWSRSTASRASSLCGGTHVRSTAEIGAVRDPRPRARSAFGRPPDRGGDRRRGLGDPARTGSREPRRDAGSSSSNRRAARRAARSRAPRAAAAELGARARAGRRDERDRPARRRHGRRRAARPVRPLQAAEQPGRRRARLARGRQRAPGRELRRERCRADLGRRGGEGRSRRSSSGGGGGRPDDGLGGGKEPREAARRGCACSRARAAGGRAHRSPKVLALDYGSARTGIAVSDPTGTLARPVGVAEKVGTPRGMESLLATIREEQPKRVVVGLPLTLRGKQGEQARETLAFVAQLRAALEVPVETYDEPFHLLARRRRRRPRRRLHPLELAWEWPAPPAEPRRSGGPPDQRDGVPRRARRAAVVVSRRRSRLATAARPRRRPRHRRRRGRSGSSSPRASPGRRWASV